MAVQKVNAEGLMQMAEALGYAVLDVRSPGEYSHAHIPGAYSLALFNDEERKEIGTAYKQVSREEAIKIGLDAFGPKMRKMVEEVERLVSKRGNKEDQSILVHCWRGGMRSAAVAWLLDLYGFKVYLLEGGYKAYRQWVISQWETSRRFAVLNGATGAGKTRILNELEKQGHPVLDLEGVAKHKGSAFGGLDDIERPSQEMFENLLAMRLRYLDNNFRNRTIWIEGESQRIGDINIPFLFYRNIEQHGTGIWIEVPFEIRLNNIVADYSKYKIEHLINSIVRIKKRLGPMETKKAIAYLIEGDIRECFSILLHYYDKRYSVVAGMVYNINGTDRTVDELVDLLITCDL